MPFIRSFWKIVSIISIIIWVFLENFYNERFVYPVKREQGAKRVPNFGTLFQRALKGSSGCSSAAINTVSTTISRSRRDCYGAVGVALSVVLFFVFDKKYSFLIPFLYSLVVLIKGIEIAKKK